MKGITSKFVKDTATKLGTKALEAGVNKVGNEIGTRAANKVISTVDEKFFKPASVKTIELIKPIIKDDIKDETNKPLGNVIMKELNKKSNDETINKYIAHKRYYGYGVANSRHIPSGYGYKTNNNKQFQDKLNKLLK